MIALFSRRNGDFEAILLRWKRAGGERGVDAGWVLGAVEIEDDCAGLIEAVAGKRGIEESAGLVGRGFAGGVTEDEKEVFGGWVFDDWFEAEGLAVEGEFGRAG